MRPGIRRKRSPVSDMVLRMSTAVRRFLSTPAFTGAMPYLALLGGMVSLAIGTSYAKQLFPVVGAEGTSSLRVGLSALVLVAIWRPWRFRLSRADAVRVLLYGLVLGLMNLCFYMSL